MCSAKRYSKNRPIALAHSHFMPVTGRVAYHYARYILWESRAIATGVIIGIANDIVKNSLSGLLMLVFRSPSYSTTILYRIQTDDRNL
jgi:cell shape-determining protein MreD